MEDGWDSKTHAPFPSSGESLGNLGKFNLSTAYEVFEDVPDLNVIMKNLTKLMLEDSLVLFSTGVSDEYIKANSRINWWYASPRNCHISLFSKQAIVSFREKYNLSSASNCTGMRYY
jgi:Methyltransferase domain